MRVLIVEDEPNLGRQLRSTLEGAGYAVDLATDGEDGHYLGSTESYDKPVRRVRAVALCWTAAQPLLPTTGEWAPL